MPDTPSLHRSGLRTLQGRAVCAWLAVVVAVGLAAPASAQAPGQRRCTSAGAVEVFVCNGSRLLPLCRWRLEPEAACVEAAEAAGPPPDPPPQPTPVPQREPADAPTTVAASPLPTGGDAVTSADPTHPEPSSPEGEPS